MYQKEEITSLKKVFKVRKNNVTAKDKRTALRIHLSSWQFLRVLQRQTVFLQQSTRQKYCQGAYFLAKYLFSLQLLILTSPQNYYLQTRNITCMCQRSACTYYKKSDLLYFGQFIHPFSLHSHDNGTSFAFMLCIIILAKFCDVTFLNNFYFVSFFYHLFICPCQRKVRLVTLSKGYLYRFLFQSLFLVLSLLLNSNKASRIIFKTQCLT